MPCRALPRFPFGIPPVRMSHRTDGNLALRCQAEPRRAVPCRAGPCRAPPRLAKSGRVSLTGFRRRECFIPTTATLRCRALPSRAVPSHASPCPATPRFPYGNPPVRMSHRTDGNLALRCDAPPGPAKPSLAEPGPVQPSHVSLTGIRRRECFIPTTATLPCDAMPSQAMPRHAPPRRAKPGRATPRRDDSTDVPQCVQRGADREVAGVGSHLFLDPRERLGVGELIDDAVEA